LLDTVTSVAATLRGENLCAQTVTVKLRDYDFRTRSRSRTLPEPVESDAPIYEVACAMLHELRSQRRVPARLLGVALSGLLDGDATRQLGLFTQRVAGESDRDRTLSRTVDQLRERYGREILRPGRLLERADD
jgi:DNA polymerase-4